jgi:DNA-binding NarL/FixJ family response regulator
MTAHSDRTIRILVVDDHRFVRQGRRGFRNGEPDLEVVGAAADGRRATNLDRYQFPPEDQSQTSRR